MNHRRGNKTKAVIRELLREQGSMPKGAIERAVYEANRSYGDTTARRLREMAEDGEVVKSSDGEGVTWYSLPTPGAAPAANLNAEAI